MCQPLNSVNTSAALRSSAAWQLEWSVLPEMARGTAAALSHAVCLAETMVVDERRMAATLAGTDGLLLAEAVSFALSEHMPRADAQALVKRACTAALASGRDLVAVVSEQTDAPVDWLRLRACAEKPPGADRLVQRVLEGMANDQGEAK